MGNAYQQDMTGKKEISKIKRGLITLLITVVLLGCGVYGGLYILLQGPSAYAGREFIRHTQDVPVVSDVVRFIADADMVQEALSRSEDTPQSFCVYPQVD